MTTDDGTGWVAARYLQGGLSVIPIRADGTKAPALPSWAEYQRRHATAGELAAWYDGTRRGVAILGGPVSGGLEILDIDERGAWGTFRVVVRTLLDAEGETLPTLPVIRTPSDGRHVYWRHDGDQQGNQKLAQDANGHTLIETRGKGGYVLAPGCPPACHPTGRTYDLLRGDLCAVPTITDTQRAILLDAARSLSAAPASAEMPRETPHARVTDGTRPGDLYNQQGAWDTLLRAHGWRKVGQHGACGLWRRPGKERGSCSATTNYAGCGLLYVWSSNAHPFAPGRAYSLFSARALLDYGGDFRACAQALAHAGYCPPNDRAEYYSPYRRPTGEEYSSLENGNTPPTRGMGIRASAKEATAAGLLLGGREAEGHSTLLGGTEYPSRRPAEYPLPPEVNTLPSWVSLERKSIGTAMEAQG